MWGAYFCMGAYERNVVVVIKMGAYIHGVLILCGCLLSQFYGNRSTKLHILENITNLLPPVFFTSAQSLQFGLKIGSGYRALLYLGMKVHPTFGVG